MDLIKLTCDFEVWKIANSLAEEFYPVNYPEERKADRERLIDFKDGLRNIKKSKHTLERNLEELEKLLSYLNPKRRWEYSDLSMIDSIYRIELRADDLFDMMERGDIRFKKTDVYDIYRFLFEHEIYDREALVFLAKVYEIELPKKIEWYEASDDYEFDASEISRARKILKVDVKDVKKVVNDAIISLNWGIGKRLSAEFTGDNKPEYGKKVVAEVSKRLEQEYGSGFDKTSISRMIKFYQEFPDFEKVATLSQQLTWSHFVEILPINDELKRDFYAAMCMQENWSVRTLRERKKSMLYERTAISKKPEETIKNEIAELRDDGKMSLDLFYRDPYMLDFLGLRDTYSEKDLENAILAELEKFILEMGSDFAFLARQKHFVLDGKDYYMDLLFYHRGLKRLVLVELKLGEFEPQDKGQVELYLRWLEKNERVEGEESPVALILCAEKSQETIELMQLDHGNIHVGQYMTKMPPKELLEQKLSLAIANARELLEQRKEE